MKTLTANAQNALAQTTLDPVPAFESKAVRATG